MDYEIPVTELRSKLDAKEHVTVLDVREFWEYAAARIEGSKHIPMGEMPSRSRQELDPQVQIVVVCHHGVRSLKVTNWLRQQGFERAQSLRGGIDEWSRTIDSKVPVY